MARTVKVHLVDDLDGTVADETVKFALDGTQYEIDLSNANAAALRECFAQFVRGARKTSRGAVIASRRAGTGTSGSDREQNRAVRAWAKRHGKQISERGRIPQSIVDEYHGVAR